MRTSDQVDKIAKDFRAAQEGLEPVKKTASNPYYKSSYAPLDACYAAAVTALHAHSISVIQATDLRGEQFVLTTRLQHDSGQFYEGDYLLNPVKPDPQGYGSATTYARRYALCAMVGLCPEDDDDGNAASGKHGQATNTPAQRATPKNNHKTKPGDELKAKVAMWAGVQAEDIPGAVRQVMERCGLPTDRKQVTTDHLNTALAWVLEQMNDGVEFTEAVAPQRV